MFNKILSTASMAVVSAVVLISMNVSASAASLYIEPSLPSAYSAGNEQATPLTINDNDVVYGGNKWATNDNSFTTMDGIMHFEGDLDDDLDGNNYFTNDYWFDVQSAKGSTQIFYGFQVEDPFPNPETGLGIENLQFAWNDEAFRELTDAGAQASGAFWYTGHVANGENVLHIRGTTLRNGGGYKFQISAIPLPPAALLFGTALFGIGVLRRRKDKKATDIAA